MIFLDFSFTWFSDLWVKKFAFSADQLNMQKENHIFQPCRHQFEAAVFNQERLLHYT